MPLSILGFEIGQPAGKVRHDTVPLVMFTSGLRFFAAVFLILGLGSGSASAQSPAASPAPPPRAAPENLVSGYILPLLVLNTVGVEYERVLHPAVGGIAGRAHMDYVFLGIFDMFGIGAGVHYVYYVPLNIQLDPNQPSGAPAGPFVGVGTDVTWWQGRFFGAGPYEARVRGLSVEPNFYVGYRLIIEKLFIAPRAGLGYGFGGGRYRDDAGNRAFYSRGNGVDLHVDFVVGLAF